MSEHRIHGDDRQKYASPEELFVPNEVSRLRQTVLETLFLQFGITFLVIVLSGLLPFISQFIGFAGIVAVIFVGFSADV